MNETLIGISLLIANNWYSEDGKTQYNIDPSNDELEGDFITIASFPLNQNSTLEYKLFEKDNVAYIKIGDKEYSIEEITKDTLSLKSDNSVVKLHAKLPANR